MGNITKTVIEMGTTYGGKILLALAALIIGRIIIGFLLKILGKVIEKYSQEPTVTGIIKKIIQTLLHIVLFISIIEILGVPMSSVIAVLASCGLAVGLALQGALSNVAGGIMLIIAKPFKAGDFIEAAGGTGIVKEIGLLYTIIITVDNKRVVVPNGGLMNAVVTNYTAEDARRVDIDFKVTNDIDIEFVKKTLVDAETATPGVLADPAPFARLVGVDDDTCIFQVRAWCKSANYWDVYFDVIENCSKAIRNNGIENPEDRIAIRVIGKEQSPTVKEH